MRKNLLLIVVLSILVASPLVGCGQGQSTPSLAIFSTGGGNVSVMKAGTDTWIEAEVEMSLEPGDTIRSGDNSSAEITFLDGSTIELQAGTEVEVVSLNISTETDSATIRIKQTIGSIIFRVTKIVDPASRYEVETPAGTVAIRGSAMQVNVIEDGTTRATNLEGDIWAVAQGVELQIPEGRQCIIRPGQPPELVCDLTISSTTGGNVTTPGEGTFPYEEGAVIDLVAEAEEGYQFGSWTGDVGAIAGVNAATTTITMQDNYSVTATFEEDHVVTFPDPNLEAAIRQTISKPEGPIYGSDLDGLTYLDVSTKNITDLTGLECATSLTHLLLYTNLISDISPLANLTSLTYLDLSGNRISDISPLVNLTSLAWLWLSDNQISDISPLANLTSLTYLSLRINQIGDMSPLANLTSLVGLALERNQISSIAALANLTSLIYLWLSGNQISDISPLANLTGLTHLSLGINQISDISPLANLTSLTDLLLGVNQISDISPLANLTNLTMLLLTNNQISNIMALANLTSLAWLSLMYNQITDISPLVDNEGLSEGDEVDLRGNPLSSDSRNVYIPQLEARGVSVDY
jgi:Leucine-rich repeat (LRR) protein